MPATKVPKSLAEQIADLEDPAPKDIDPEEFGAAFENRGDSGSESQDEEAIDARQHYVDVGKSKLRKSEGISLGPQYSGARVSRYHLIAGESDDDPFGSGASQENGLSSEEKEDEGEDVADPDDVEMDGIDGERDEDIDSDEAFGEGDEERFKEYKFSSGTAARQRQGNGVVKKGINDILVRENKDMDSNMELEDDGSNKDAVEELDGESDGDSDTSEESNLGNKPLENGFGDDNEISDSNEESASVSENTDDVPDFDKKSDDRALLRQMMASEQKSVVATITQAVKADATKGRAVIHQSRTFSSLLNTRMRLQKALVAANSIAATPSTPTTDDSAVKAAEQAALTLWNQLNSLRTSLESTVSNKNPQKRTFEATISTPSSAVWSEMQSHESVSTPSRRAILQKWSMKTAPTSSLPARNKFSNTPTQQPLLDMLDTQLSSPNLERLIQKTQLPSSCAPLQAQTQVTTSKTRHTESEEGVDKLHDPIYDDSSFYTLLLRDLVEQRRSLPSTSFNAPQPSISFPPPVKIRKKVDTKASKGRKMRYNVHEKLQNFMAREDRCTWGERQVGEFFGGLLGNRSKLGVKGTYLGVRKRMSERRV
ncbi:MAG: hypothetical protein Q9187_008603 [Circinaria calcarea]